MTGPTDRHPVPAPAVGGRPSPPAEDTAAPHGATATPPTAPASLGEALASGAGGRSPSSRENAGAPGPAAADQGVGAPAPPGAASAGEGVLDLGFARLDLGRERRQGLPEVVYGPGKTPEQISALVAGLLAHNSGPVLVTRVGPETAGAVMSRTADGGYDPEARLLVWRPAPAGAFDLVVAAAGTSDRPVAVEAAAVATAMGLATTTLHDVGVAGLDRVLAVRERLQAADAVIVVAGMEGALASVVGGLVRCPVVAVPTSTGYGASLEGVTALLAMHASCAAGVTVVNIDSGFGAAAAAHRLAQAMAARAARP